MSELVAGLLGGFIGGALGVASAFVASYFGPLWLDQRRAAIKEEHDYGPRKRLLKQCWRSSTPRYARLSG